MSGVQFKETLCQLGYPNADTLDPQMFDWMFENQNILPFLDWFCTNVSSNNVVSAKEISEFKELEKGGQIILEGKQLEDALKNLAVTDKEEDLSEEALSEDISTLKQELEDAKEKKHELIHRRNKLSLHHTGLCHKLTKLTPLESQCQKDYKKALEQLHTDNTKVNESMKKLVDAVGKLTSLYSEPMKTKKGSESGAEPVFLSQVNLDDYYQVEEKYSQEVTNFTRKQFFENIGRMTGDNDGSRYELLDIKDPESLLIQGEKDENILQDCKELARLQSVFVKSESDRIFALMEDKNMTSTISAAEDVLNDLQLASFPTDSNKLSYQIQETQTNLEIVKQDINKLIEREIPILLQELAPLQGNQILTGDYNLKLARQDYFTSNQDKLIQLLVAQKARTEFLTMLYEVEARHHRDVHRLLTAVQLKLNTQLKDWKHRMKLMDDPLLTSSRYKKATIDTRDTSTSRLHQMLDEECDNEGNKQLFLTYDSLLEGGQRLASSHQESYTAMKDAATKYYDKLDIVESNIKTCEDTIYKGSSTTNGQPVLSPSGVQENIKQLEDLLQKLEASIVSNLRIVNDKKTALKSDALLTRERSLFVDFHINPDRIQQALDKLTKRIQAMSVQ